MMLECIQETDGFILGEKYKCLGISSGYVEIEDMNGDIKIMPDKYFNLVHKEFSHL